ncbi:MAG: gas vesicle protein GvpG [Syntrophaceae bacterium]|nr:gas vesicle protein GvpG [Syntrophaceae bacterium]
MFLVDDILTAPFKGVLWIFEEIHKAALQERQDESELITAELQKLYMLLESGSITEEEFDQKEAQLLDRLDSLQETGDEIEDEPEEDQDEYEDDDEFESGSSIEILDSGADEDDRSE